ncbi:MAG: hypothetical protein ACR2QF_12655 [Geminicoccaceae bacterium]
MNLDASFDAEDGATDPPAATRRQLVAGAVDGLDALHLSKMASVRESDLFLHVARDAARADHLVELIKFYAPDLSVVAFPAWDCLPYDRVSPNGDIMAKRLDVLGKLLGKDKEFPDLVITTVNALLQKVPTPDVISSGLFTAKAGSKIDREQLLECLARNGYRRSGTVVEPGDFAVRGGIIDIFPTGAEQPLRLDLFGDELEAIRAFDPLTQRSLGKVDRIELLPVSEVLLDNDAVERFRVGYLQHFGAATSDPLFESVTHGRPFPGMEHWLPLFHDQLVPITDYLPNGCQISFDPLAEEAIAARHGTIGEHFESRRDPPEIARSMGDTPYRPLPPDALYISEQQLQRVLTDRLQIEFSTFRATPQSGDDIEVVDLNGQKGYDFAAERTRPDQNLFDAVIAHIKEAQQADKHVLLAAASEGSLERLKMVLADHGLDLVGRIQSWKELDKREIPVLAVLPIDHGFTTPKYRVLSEADIFGDRLSRPKRNADQISSFLKLQH